MLIITVIYLFFCPSAASGIKLLGYVYVIFKTRIMLIV